METWVETSRLSLEQSTLGTLREHFADNSGVLPPYRLPTIANQIIAKMVPFVSDTSDGSGLDAATLFGSQMAQQGLGLRSWLAVGRVLTSEFTTRACGPAVAGGERPDVLARLQVFVSQVIEGLTRHQMAEISSQRDEMQTALEHVVQAREDELHRVIQELSTPIMPVHRKILVMPLIGAIDDERARRITERLLDETARRQTRIVIIDVTGLAHCDAAVLSSLSGATRAVQLLGARAVLAGIRPEIAQTLAGLDLDLRAFATLADLQSAIEWALRELGMAILPRANHKTNKESKRHGN